MNERFLDIARQLKEANDKRDWQSLTGLDAQVRNEIQKALAGIKTEQDRDLAVSVLKRYEKIYELVLQDSVKYRDEISNELKKITRESKAASSYLDSSRYKA